MPVVDNQTEFDARDSDVRDSDLKRIDSFPEDEEHYVRYGDDLVSSWLRLGWMVDEVACSEDGLVVVAPVDDKCRIDKYRRLLAKRERVSDACVRK